MSHYLQTGYPKSGNTWLLTIIAILYGEQDVFKQVVPEFMVQGKTTFNNWYRTHATPGRVLSDGRKIDYVVYIVRHPLDVLCSAYRTQTEVENHTRAPFPEYLQRCLDQNGDTYYNFAHCETWTLNVETWMHYTQSPIVYIRYEDLLLSHAVLSEVAPFTSMFTQEEIETAWKNSHPFVLGQKQSGKFIGPAMSRWRELVPQYMWNGFRKQFQPYLDRFQYEI